MNAPIDAEFSVLPSVIIEPESIREFESRLTRLRVTQEVWFEFFQNDDGFEHWHYILGWTRIAGEWKVVLREIVGNYAQAAEGRDATWEFSSAPIHIREQGSKCVLQFVSKLLDLL